MHDAETDAIVAELEKAGLITVTVRPDGQEAYTLIEQGERVARQSEGLINTTRRKGRSAGLGR